MNILSGVTGKKVGEMDRLGRVTSSNSELKQIMSTVIKDRAVIIPSHSDIVSDTEVIDYIQVVPDTDPDFVSALAVYLLREGYEVD